MLLSERASATERDARYPRAGVRLVWNGHGDAVADDLATADTATDVIGQSPPIAAIAIKGAARVVTREQKSRRQRHEHFIGSQLSYDLHLSSQSASRTAPPKTSSARTAIPRSVPIASARSLRGNGRIRESTTCQRSASIPSLLISRWTNLGGADRRSFSGSRGGSWGADPPPAHSRARRGPMARRPDAPTRATRHGAPDTHAAPTPTHAPTRHRRRG